MKHSPMRYQYIFSVLTVLTLISTLASCANVTGITAHRLIDLNHGDYFSEYESFKHDETPAMLVEGYGGEIVTVALYSTRLQHAIKQDSAYIKAGTAKWFYWDNLPPDTYRAELRQGDDVLDVINFTLEPEN